MGKSSLWLDEVIGFEKFVYNKGWLTTLWMPFFKDAHPPFYHIILRLGYIFFGDNEFSLRLLFALLSSFIPLLIFQISFTLSKNIKKSFIISLLTVFHPFLLIYSREARMYGIFTLFVVMLVYFIVVYLKTNNKSYLIFADIISVLLLFTYYLSVLWVFSIYLYVYFKKKDITILYHFLIYALFLILFMFPVVRIISDKQINHQKGITTITLIFESLYFSLGGLHKPFVLSIVMFVLVFFIFLKSLVKHFKDIRFRELTFFSFLPFLFVVFLSLKIPVYTKYVLPSIVLLIVLFIGFSYRSLLFFLSVFLLNTLGVYFLEGKYYPDYRRAFRFIKKNVPSSYIKYIPSYMNFEGKYYLRSIRNLEKDTLFFISTLRTSYSKGKLVYTSYGIEIREKKP